MSPNLQKEYEKLKKKLIHVRIIEDWKDYVEFWAPKGKSVYLLIDIRGNIVDTVIGPKNKWWVANEYWLEKYGNVADDCTIIEAKHLVN